MSSKQQRIVTYSFFDLTDAPTLLSLNRKFSAIGLAAMSVLEYELWTRFYYPLAKQYPDIYDGVINEGQPLFWIGRYFRAQAQRETPS